MNDEPIKPTYGWAESVPLPPWSTPMKKKKIPKSDYSMIEDLIKSDNPFEEDTPPPAPPAKKTNKKEDDKDKPEWQTRKSVFGNTYPYSQEDHWEKHDDYWVHRDEEPAFLRYYRKCEVVGKYFPRDETVGTCYGYNICKKVAEEDYFYCNQSDAWAKNEEAMEVANCYGNLNKIRKKYAIHYVKCDITGKMFHKDHRIKLKSAKFKCVAAFAVAEMVNKALCGNVKPPIRQCTNCCIYRDYDSVAKNPDTGNLVCEECEAKIKFDGTILSYDNKNYQSPIMGEAFRLGHTFEDGVVVATNKKERVPLERRLFGVEAETELHKKSLVKEGITRFHVAYEILKTMGKDFARIVEDGTLTMNGKYSGMVEFDPDGTKNGPMFAGFEIVSAPCDLATHRLYWPKLESMKYHKMLRAWDTDTCGCHIHINKSSLSWLQAGRMLTFINHENNRQFVNKIAGRGDSRWWRYYEKKFPDILYPDRVTSPEEKDAHHRARRVALNISNPNTVEFRIFRGTINVRHILRNLEFCDALCDFCLPCSRSLGDISDYSKFITFVGNNRRKWPLLASWFVYQKHLTIGKIGEGADPKKFTIQPDMVDEPDVVEIPKENQAIKAKPETDEIPVPDDDGEEV